jgi:adenylylsulfate kinase
MRKILIMGRPGAGKTTLAQVLASRLNAVHFNADEVRSAVHRDLGFSIEDRIEHAKRMGWLSDQVVKAHGYVIADFICPTVETRAAFELGGAAYVVWVDRVNEGRFPDTNRMFQPPATFNMRIPADGTPEYWADQIVHDIQPVFDSKKPTALFIGRFQPFHRGHRELIVEGLKQIGQACIAVRNVEGISDSNPFGFEDVKSRIEYGLRDYSGRFTVVPLPNITSVLYGRDVGYEVRRIELGKELEAISATALRRRLGHAELTSNHRCAFER